MANLPPVAVLTANPAELTLPANKLTLDGSGSTDPNLNGVITNYQFKKFNSVIQNGVKKTVSVVFQNPGTYPFTLIVTDRGGLTNETTINFIVNPVRVTNFGAKVQDGDSDDQITVFNKLGVSYGRPSSISLSDFNGTARRIDDYYAASKKCIVNLNYKNSQGAVDFTTNLTDYRNRLKTFLNKYSSKIEVALCENEPTTDAFYTGPIEDYIAMLRVFAEECNNYGVKCADGAIHVENIIQIDNYCDYYHISRVNNQGHNVADVWKLVQAYATIPLTFVNIHTNGEGNTYPAGQIKKAADWLRLQTGHPIMSNEWHTDGATQNLINIMVKQMRDAGLVYSLIWGGGGSSPDDPINSGANLTTMGGWFRDAIM